MWIFELLTALEPYPDIAIDWRVGIDKLKSVDDQIDIGLRICQEPELDWVAQHICTFSEKIVASPALLKRLNFPKDLQDLAQNYPLSGFDWPQTGKDFVVENGLGIKHGEMISPCFYHDCLSTIDFNIV